ncbi:hypothetical protein [Mesorhizobium tianshanense]|uniref:Uncharacterized protein n=1 Tax=Mesorhizobium tianshanense TaxID=39844 RepID=A0A562PBS9_9HYPH|nr:hypothetical protein [Mesorhizobium tianshanense]TWI41935.1 hypothetical protein IQ26_00859 [Mesorhizobium tianshanense]
MAHAIGALRPRRLDPAPASEGLRADCGAWSVALQHLPASLFLDATDNVAVVLHLAGFSAAAAHKHAVELLDYLEVGHRKHAMHAVEGIIDRQVPRLRGGQNS